MRLNRSSGWNYDLSMLVIYILSFFTDPSRWTCQVLPPFYYVTVNHSISLSLWDGFNGLPPRDLSVDSSSTNRSRGCVGEVSWESKVNGNGEFEKTSSLAGGTLDGSLASALSNTANKLSWTNGTEEGEELELSILSWKNRALSYNFTNLCDMSEKRKKKREKGQL